MRAVPALYAVGTQPSGRLYGLDDLQQIQKPRPPLIAVGDEMMKG